MSPTGQVRPWYRPMRARRRDEAHRAATPLELFFDLCFVVAVAQAAGNLHHDVAENHLGHALTSYRGAGVCSALRGGGEGPRGRAG